MTEIAGSLWWSVEEGREVSLDADDAARRDYYIEVQGEVGWVIYVLQGDIGHSSG